MRARSSVLLLTVIAGAATSVAVLSAQRPQQPLFPEQPVPAPRTAPLFPVPPFEGQRASQAPPRPAPAPLFVDLANMRLDLKTRVVCGMTLLPAPDVDPKIALPEAVEKTKDPTTYAIRPVQPSVCW
jgi:hypothetical protein